MIRKLLVLLLLLFFINTHTYSQCTNIISFGSAVAPNDTSTETISTCNYQTEYATISSVVAGETYEITNDCGGYITVRSGTSGGPVVGSGNAPFSFTAGVAGNHYVHFNTNAACGTAENCCTTEITCTSCAGPTPPPNDEPCSAEPLAVNTPCSFLTYTNANATNSPGVPAPGCASYNGGDVWFTATVPASGNLIIDTDTGVMTDSGMAIYSGTCGALTLIECDDDDSDNGLMSSITSTGLTPGATIYIRVWEFGNNNNGTFDICVSEPAGIPANDEPCSAEPLAVNTPCSFSTYTTESATGSVGVPAPGCAGYSGGDVWFTATVPATGSIIIDTDTGVITDSGMAIYSGTCGSLTLIECDDDDSANGFGMSSITRTDLTPGATIYIRVWEFGNNNNGTFDICVSEGPIPCVLPTPVTTQSCPFVDVTPDSSSIGSCASGSASEILTAEFLDLGDTSDYNVDLISYNATTFASLASAATIPVALSDDDRWSDVPYAMPIDFCFYGNTITDFVVGANSIISFDASLANSGSGYSFDENLPSTDESLVENAIYAAYHDIDPGVTGSGPITYGTTSVGGCNAMVVLWDNIPMFDNGNFGDNTLRHTVMAVLYENTNIIEILIEEKVVDDDFFGVWNDGNAIVGVQNPGATEAVVAPCRNSLDDNWTAINEAWRFTPSGGASIANLQWLVNGVLDASYDGQTSITVTPSSTTNYTAQVTYNLCNGSTLVESDVATITVSGGKVWDGSTSNDWMEPTNWSDNLVPTAADCVIIPATANDPVLYDNANGDGLYMVIETGATLTLTSDTDNNGFASSVTIQDYIDIQGTGQLIVEDDASLIQVYDSSTAILPSATNSGNITLYRDTNVRLTDYVYWSSPVQGFDISNVYGGVTPTNYSFQWLPTIATGTFTPGVLPTGGIPICYGNWDPYGAGAMTLGKGYIVRAPTDHSAGISTATATFTGVPNNGVITQQILSGTNSFGNSNYTYNPYGLDDLTVTPFDDNWNLLGNPYPSALDAQSFLTHPNNSIIEGAVHIWTHGTQIGANGDSFYDDYTLTYDVADYITYNFSGTNSYADESFQGKIASGQGFFVLALNDNESGSVTFNNSMRDRSHENTAFYRNANQDSNTNGIEKHRIWLNLIAQNGSTSSILVGYIEGATQDKDRLFDAYIRDLNSLSIYSKIGDDRLIIQGRALPFDQNDQVPLGTVIPQAGQYTIAISNVDGLFLDENQNIYLEDTHTGIVHDLRATPYTFTETEAVDYQHRFILRYTNDALSISELEFSALTIMAPKGDYIKINSDRSPIDTVVVYDLLGRVLFDKNSINTSEFVLNNHNLSSGTYIVTATLVSGVSKAQKIVLKN